MKKGKGKTTLLYIILIPAEIISILIGSYRVGGSLYKDLRAERQADKQLEEGKFAVVEHDFYTGVIVPDLTGKEYNETFKEYEELGGGWLRIEGYDYSEEYPEYVILSQSVEPGEEIGYGRTLYVIVSLGPEPDFSREKYQNSYDDSIDEVDFCQLASDYYCNRYGVRPPCARIDGYNGDIVMIQLYEAMSDHDATWDWYYVDRNTGETTNFMGESFNIFTE